MKQRGRGAMVIATGRSDYPNQINNALVFPGIFRGALDKGVKKLPKRPSSAPLARSRRSSRSRRPPQLLSPTSLRPARREGRRACRTLRICKRNKRTHFSPPRYSSSHFKSSICTVGCINSSGRKALLIGLPGAYRSGSIFGCISANLF